MHNLALTEVIAIGWPEHKPLSELVGQADPEGTPPANRGLDEVLAGESACPTFLLVPSAAQSVEHCFRGGAPGKLCRAERTGGGEPFAKFAIGDQTMHRSGDGGRVARVEFQGGAARDAVHR